MPATPDQSTPDSSYGRTVQFPSGHVVAFPDSLSEDELTDAAKRSWQQLSNSQVGRFTKGAYSTTLGALADAAHSYWDSVRTPADAVGDNFISDLAANIAAGHVAQAHKAIDAYHAGNLVEAAGHAMGAALPLVGPAAAAAGEKIGQGNVAEGLGEGAGLVASTLVGGKATEDLEATVPGEAAEAARVEPDRAVSVEKVKPVPPMTEAERSAAAFARRTYGTDQPDVQLVGRQVIESAPSEAQEGSSIERQGEAGAPTEAEINSFIRKHYGDKAPEIRIVKDKAPKAASSNEVDAAADAEAKKLSQRPTFNYSKESGELQNVHRVDVHSDKGANGYVTATEPADDPRVWTIDKADVQPSGTGAGMQAYQHLATEAQRHGAELRSGSVVSKPAARVWEKLKDQGLNVIEEQGKGGKTYRIPAPTRKPVMSQDLTDELQEALGGK